MLYDHIKFQKHYSLLAILFWSLNFTIFMKNLFNYRNWLVWGNILTTNLHYMLIPFIIWLKLHYMYSIFTRTITSKLFIQLFSACCMYKKENYIGPSTWIILLNLVLSNNMSSLRSLAFIFILITFIYLFLGSSFPLLTCLYW